ncbi:effector-associated constant component EACC1 [Streptomyces sp. AS58]|uniref:effector-associated constant component EACC1 n=1 Tax=Streptomyces sp. AS58 TaxID=1519489 RepID=UPI000A692988|nr:hypothetical protein [Streptomyces sp. AS58]
MRRQREIVNAFHYQDRTGCQSDLLPHDLPLRGAMMRNFSKWGRSRSWLVCPSRKSETDIKSLTALSGEQIDVGHQGGCTLFKEQSLRTLTGSIRRRPAVLDNCFRRMIDSEAEPEAGRLRGMWDIMGADHQGSLELAVSREGELNSLRTWLDLAAIPGVDVRRVAGTPGPGEQGALDTLTVLATSTALVAAIRILPEFLRARRSDLSVTVTVRGKKLTVDARNVEEVMPILEKLLDE